MMFTSPMRLLAAVALDTDSEAIARELLERGALELVSIKELSGEWKSRLSQVEPKVNLARLGELRKRVEGFMAMARPVLAKPLLDGSANGGPVDLDRTDKFLDSVAAEVNGLRERQKALQDEILKLDEIRRQIVAFGDLKTGAAASSNYSFLSIQAGLLPAGRVDDLAKALEGIPSVVLPSAGYEQLPSGEQSGVVLVSLKRDALRVQGALEHLGWQDARLPESAGDDSGEALAKLDAKTDALRTRQAECSAELGSYFTDHGNKLAGLWAALRVEELIATVRSSFSRTDRTVLFSGWIPLDKCAEVESGIRKAAAGGCSIEWMEPRQGEAAAIQAPVAMKNPPLLKPFEGLVRNYAVPEYGNVDPTPFVAVAYLSMFGLMFGDAGQGLVVALIGILGGMLARKAGKAEGLFRLMVYCGGAAMVAGVLFGSYFGFKLFPPLWFDYHGIVTGHLPVGAGAVRSVYDILGITIRFGMIVLGTGFVINWINLAHKRDWFTLILDKAGLLGGWIYGIGAWVAFVYVGSDYRSLPPGGLLALLLGLPTLTLAVKGPLEFFMHARHHGKRFKSALVMDFFMEWVVEVLEIYSGYLSNTLSFMRVAGLGIAHVSLMTAFLQIARMISPEGPLSPLAIAVLVLGNALVIALEGLSAGIQSLRLNYYEFFSKYFNGTGRAYRPVSFNAAQ
ncbi:MAG: V-type ATPase 116kDa subunit family protein [Spirochaetota bacterium]